jgi:hypothetical protein
MSETTDEHSTAAKPNFENKYKRTMSLNDSWNLGEDLKEVKPGK